MGGSEKTRRQEADVLKLILLPQPAFFLLSVRTKGPAWASCPDKRGGWMLDSRPRRVKKRGAAVGKWEVAFGWDVEGTMGGTKSGSGGCGWSVWDYVPGQPASHGRGRLGRRVHAMGAPLADKNQTEALQSSDTLKGSQRGSRRTNNKWASQEGFF